MVWTHVNTAGKPPAPRTGHTLTLTTDKKSAVLYGGRYKKEYFDDVYILRIEEDPPRWIQTEIQTSVDNMPPPARYGHSMVSFLQDEFVLFGGHTKTPMLDNLFLLKLDIKEGMSLFFQFFVPFLLVIL